jgi:hypothetical protein
MKIQAAYLGKRYSKANRKDDEDDTEDNKKKKEDGKKTELKKRPAAANVGNDDSGKDPNGL